MTDTNPVGPAKRPPRRWETSDFWKDYGERVVASYLFALGVLITVADFDWRSKEAWIGAFVGAGFATVKALIGAFRRDTTSPVSLL